MFEPTPKNSTIDGSRWPKDPKAYNHWDQMDWTQKEWRTASIWSKDDSHWRVPHKDGETWHRIRAKKKDRLSVTNNH